MKTNSEYKHLLSGRSVSQDDITTGSVVSNAAGSTPCAAKTGKPTFELLSNQRPNNGLMLSGMPIATSGVLLVDGAFCSGLTMRLVYGRRGLTSRPSSLFKKGFVNFFGKSGDSTGPGSRYKL